MMPLCIFMFSVAVAALAADCTDALRRPWRRAGKQRAKIVALIVAGIPLIWVSTDLVVSFATTPLILVLIRLRREQQRRELYLVHVVGPSVREALRKVEGKVVVTGQAGASEPHVSLPYPARGSATTADYDEYLAEKKIAYFWKPEVEVDSKFLPKQIKK